jgi:ribosomal protein S18 acetylase RimI-like enzyme
LSGVSYRSFRNSDPPRILRLWHACELGRGAAKPQSTDAFEVINYAQPYFDARGLILAESEGELVGLVHAGFAFTEERTALDPARGVICVVLVRPDHRRRGIGRELMRRAEARLAEQGATQITAGESRGADPFYYGLYGGSRPSGFLESDPLAAPFMAALGYQAVESIGVYQRDLTIKRDPVNMHIMAVRRSTELQLAEGPLQPTYWWYTHLGRVESLRFRLANKQTGEPVAAVTVIGLDHYVAKWNERAIGLVDLFVLESHRNQGYGQTLLVEALRQVRQELITRADIHVSDTNPVLAKAVTVAGFQRVDTGHIYRRPQA